MEFQVHTFFPDPGAGLATKIEFPRAMKATLRIIFLEFLIYVKFANLNELNLNAN